MITSGIAFVREKVTAKAGDIAGQRFVSLEGLRAYMAWWVVAMHLLSLTGSEFLLPPFITNFIVSGGAAVNVFMIVSGFVIAHLLIVRPEPYPVYLRRRAYRIFPIYLLCLALAIPLATAQMDLHSAPWVMQAARWHTGFEEQAHHFWTHLALHLTMLHGIVPDTILPFSSWTILGPTWSLSLEWQFYLLAPAILFFIRKSLISCVATIVLFCAATAVLRTGIVGTWQFPSIVFIAMPFFLIGILSRVFFATISSFSVLWTIGVGMVVAYVLRDFRYVICIWTFFLVAMRFESIKDGNVFVRAILWVATNRVITTLGKASYSTYLVHILVLSFVARITASIHGGSTVVGAREAAIITLILLPPISLLLYHYIEKPFIRIGAKREDARKKTRDRIQ